MNTVFLLCTSHDMVEGEKGKWMKWVKFRESLKEYDCDSVADMQSALKEIFGPLFEGMLQGEMDNHLGYKSNSKEPKSTKNRRIGSNPKTLKTSMGGK